MDTFYIYHIWRKDQRFGAEKSEFFWEKTTSDLQEAQRMCSSGKGDYIYTIDQAFYVTQEN